MGRIAEYQRKGLVSSAVGVVPQTNTMESVGNLVAQTAQSVMQLTQEKRDASESLQAEAAYAQYAASAARVINQAQLENSKNPEKYEAAVQQQLGLLENEIAPGIANPRIREKVQNAISLHKSAVVGSSADWVIQQNNSNAVVARENAAIIYKNDAVGARTPEEFNAAVAATGALYLGKNSLILEGVETAKQGANIAVQEIQKDRIDAQIINDPYAALADLNDGKYDTINLSIEGTELAVTLPPERKAELIKTAEAAAVGFMSRQAISSMAGYLKAVGKQAAQQVIRGEFTEQVELSAAAQIVAQERQVYADPATQKIADESQAAQLKSLEMKRKLSDLCRKQRMTSASSADSAYLSNNITTELLDLDKALNLQVRGEKDTGFFAKAAWSTGKVEKTTMKKPTVEQVRAIYEIQDRIEQAAWRGELTTNDFGALNKTLAPMMEALVSGGIQNSKISVYNAVFKELNDNSKKLDVFVKDNASRIQFVNAAYEAFVDEYAKVEGNGKIPVTADMIKGIKSLAINGTLPRFDSTYRIFKAGDMITTPGGNIMKVGADSKWFDNQPTKDENWMSEQQKKAAGNK